MDPRITPQLPGLRRNLMVVAVAGEEVAVAVVDQVVVAVVGEDAEEEGVVAVADEETATVTVTAMAAPTIMVLARKILTKRPSRKIETSSRHHCHTRLQ